MYADVIVDISAESLDHTYQYLIPERIEDKIKSGVPVVIPFGSRTISGYVVELSDKPKIEPGRIKPLTGIASKANTIDGRMIALAWWMKEQFGSTMNAALKTVIPISRKVEAVVIRTIYPKADREVIVSAYAEAQRRKYVARERFLKELLETGQLDYNLTIRKLNISNTVIKKSEADGLITVCSETAYRNPFSNIDRSGYIKPELNPEQAEIAKSIKSDLSQGIRNDYLLFGVTGSGKTEVYMDIIDEVISKGKQVIMLIPEIALTYQTVKRFYMRFGERISVMNSKLSSGERYDQYLRAKRGETDIVIGPRSALFTPFERLGLIIIDEEHEGSYRSETAPCYNAREVALKRAEDEGASVILGSATPSVEAFTMAEAGRIKRFTLKTRAGGAHMPTVHIVDMREELRCQNRSMFSIELKRLITEKLKKKEQVMIFLNRRGYSGTVSCRSCGHVMKCPHCDVSLTYHNDGRLVCHYCGYSQMKTDLCPECGSPYIGTFGLGTEKVEEKLQKEWPDARILRMDADTTSSKDSYEEILSAFANEEADILVGTQMIVKGHDFHKVTLVGILMADMSLFAPDFRCGERTYQIITQASGRAGRGELDGDVVIQTYNPEHYCITTAARADYESFYREEFAYRKLMNYPPARCLMSVMLMSKKEEEAAELIEKLKNSAQEYINGRLKEKNIGQGSASIRLVGPVDGSPAKLRDYYRKQIYLKSNDYGILVDVKNELTQTSQDFDGDVIIQYNFN